MTNLQSTSEPYLTVEEYYQKNADIINTNFPGGFQIATIESPNKTYKFLCDSVELQERDFIIEFGCGNGQFLEYLCANYEYVSGVGVDISFNQAHNAANRLKPYEINGDPRFNLFSANMDLYSCVEEYFDKCFLIESIGYSADINALVRAVSIGLKQGGKVLIKNPFKIVNDIEADKVVMDYFKDISTEYGYNENSIGMIPDLDIVKNAFLNFGFALENQVVVPYETDTYNSILENSPLSEEHPKYLNHIQFPPHLNYSSNTYSECIILIFRKTESKDYDDNLPEILKTQYESLQMVNRRA